jgi:hypothetical protein
MPAQLPGMVEISDKPLSEYLMGNKSQSGIMVCRLHNHLIPRPQLSAFSLPDCLILVECLDKIGGIRVLFAVRNRGTIEALIRYPITMKPSI